MSDPHVSHLRSLNHLLSVLSLFCLLSACTIEGGVVLNEGGSTGTGGAPNNPNPVDVCTPTDDPLPEATEQLLNTNLLVRLIPLSYLNDVNLAYIYCTAITLSESLLLLPAECIKRGVAYGQVFQGAELDFSTQPRALSRVKAIYTHPDYESLTDTDMALIQVDPPLTTEVAKFSLFSTTQVSAYVRVGYVKEAEGRFRRVSRVAPPTSCFEKEVLFGLGSDSACDVPGGGVLYPINPTENGVVGMNLRGGENCAETGVSVRLDVHRNFITSTQNTPTLPNGQSGEVRPLLSCAQSSLCEDDIDCQAQVYPEHVSYRNELFNCEREPCNLEPCCEEEVATCLSARVPAPNEGPPVAGQAAGVAMAGAGVEAGGSSGGSPESGGSSAGGEGGSSGGGAAPTGGM